MHQSPLQYGFLLLTVGLTLIFADTSTWAAWLRAPDGAHSSACDSAIARPFTISGQGQPAITGVAAAPAESSPLAATLSDPYEGADARSSKRAAAQTIPDPLYADPSGERAPQNFYETLRETGTQAMAEAIVYLRDLALKKAKPLPQKIRQKVAPYFPAELLQKARYVTDWSPALGAALRQFLDTDRYAMAVTLDHVIVFADRESLDNLWLWIHELKHVEQYQRWGIKTFAGNYLADYQKVEREADEYAARVLAKTRR